MKNDELLSTCRHSKNCGQHTLGKIELRIFLLHVCTVHGTMKAQSEIRVWRLPEITENNSCKNVRGGTYKTKESSQACKEKSPLGRILLALRRSEVKYFKIVIL